MKLSAITVAAALLFAPVIAQAAMEARLGDLVLSKAWTRATPPRAPTGAGYITVENRGSEPDRLVAARTPVASTTEFHTMSMENGIMKMRRIENGIEIPPGGTIALKPGGSHLMFARLKQPIEKGSSVPVTLVFERAGEVTLDFMAAPVGSREPPAMKHGH